MTDTRSESFDSLRDVPIDDQPPPPPPPPPMGRDAADPKSPPVSILRQKSVVFSSIDRKAEYNVEEPPNSPLEPKECGSSHLAFVAGCPPASTLPVRIPGNHYRTVFRLIGAHEAENTHPLCRVIHTTFAQVERFPNQQLDSYGTTAVFYLGDEFRYLTEDARQFQVKAIFTYPRTEYPLGDYCSSDESSKGYYCSEEMQEDSDSSQESILVCSDSSDSETEVEEQRLAEREHQFMEVEDTKMVDALMNASPEAVEEIVDAARALCELDVKASLPSVKEEEEEEGGEEEWSSGDAYCLQEQSPSPEFVQERRPSADFVHEQSPSPPPRRKDMSIKDHPSLRNFEPTNIDPMGPLTPSPTPSVVSRTESMAQPNSPSKARKQSWMQRVISDLRKLKLGDSPQLKGVDIPEK